MISPNKTFRRLGIVGAAAVVGLVPVTLAGGSAFAASNASLALASTTPSTATTATNSFTTGTSTSSITITSQLQNPGSTTTAEQLPSCTLNAGTPPTCTNYTVSYTSGSTTTSDGVTGVTISGPSGTTPAPGDTAALTLASAIPAGATATVTISGVTNGTNGSVVYFTDNDGAGPVNTNPVTIGYASVSVPSVTSVNPSAFTANGGEPFTVTGTGFAPSSTNPVVCFVESGYTAPAGGTATAPCSSTATTDSSGNIAVVQAPLYTTSGSGGQTAGQLQGTSPVLTIGKTYNVVVYNWNPAAGTSGAYTAGSPTSSTSLVGVTTNSAGNLNVVPENGVRAVDSRTGTGLAKGALPVGTPVAIPLSDFETAGTALGVTVPTNVPTIATGLDLNVTAVAPASGGNLQVWTNTTCSSATNPGTATVNFQQPQDTNNSQIIPILAGATQVCVQDNGASVNVVMDVDGYTLTNGYNGNPTRLLDTRSGQGGLLGPLSGNQVYTFTAPAGLDGATVALNVADVAPTTQGNLRVAPEPSAGPAVPSTVVDNYIVNTDGSAMLIVKVPANGKLDIYSATGSETGAVNVVIDELGTFPATGLATTTSSLTALNAPFRIFDSRPNGIPAGSSATVAASPSGSGSVFVPAGALGVDGNLSDINPPNTGYLATYPAGHAVPGTASEANFPGQTRNTNSMTALNPSNGEFSIYAGGSNNNSTYDVSAYIQ